MEVGRIKPILFNTEMVKAILDGRKTVTRRIMKPQPKFEYGYDYPHEDEVGIFWKKEESYSSIKELIDECPYGKRGDILYVRETWLKADDGYKYKANACAVSEELRMAYGYKWRPSIHMPKEAARIFLRVTDVRLERLQNITEEQAKAEGIPRTGQEWEYNCYRDGFITLWNSLYAKRGYGWEANPWVWAIEFEKVEK